MTKAGIVYMTVNCINGMRYIGRDANSNYGYKGGGRRFKIALKKYGKDNFIKITLRRCGTKEERILWEQHYLDLYNAGENPRFYNITQSSLWGNDGNGIKVYQYDLSGRLLNQYDSALEASRESGVNRSSISKCVIGIQKSAGGYYWSYRNIIQHPVLKKHSDGFSVPVCQYNKFGVLVGEFCSLSEASRVTGINVANIHKCASGKRNSAGGFIFKFKNL